MMKKCKFPWEEKSKDKKGRLYDFFYYAHVISNFFPILYKKKYCLLNELEFGKNLM